QRFDVGKRSFHADVRVPERYGAKPGGVDQHTSTGEEDELPGGRGVAAPLIVLAHVAGRLYVGADETIQERRLPDTGRADQCDRAVAVRECAHLLDTLAGDRAGDDHVDAGRRALRDSYRVIDVRGVGGVGFRQHDNRVGAA